MLKELMIDEYGVNIGKKSERMVIKKKGELIEEHAIKELDDLVIGHRCGAISIPLLEELIQNGTQIHFIDYKQEPFVTVYTPAHHGTVRTRRNQLLSYEDERGVTAAKEMLCAKIQNQMNLLKYYLKSRKDRVLVENIRHELEAMEREQKKIRNLDGKKIDDVRQDLLKHEGHAAKRYWKCLRMLLAHKAEVPGRDHSADDPFNMMLNYGYAMLASQVTSCLLRSGLELYAGFIHVDRSGRPSLCLDFMEMFRQPVVDRAVVSLLSRGHPIESERDEDGSKKLKKETVHLLRNHLRKRLDTRERYKGKDLLLKTILQIQARELASFFREGKPFKGYVMRW